MEVLIWLGAVVTLCGLALLVWCIIKVMKARKADLTDDALRATLQKVVPVNTGALFLSVIGLMMVILGIAFS